MTSPRLRRLKLDSERLESRFKNWPMIHVTGRTGMPPEVYQVTYNVKGLYVAPDGSILERNQHVMEVNLSLAYPRRAPQCKMLTPVFHPNFDDASVCIGDFWAAAEGLDDLIIRIGRMITYQEYNIKSPLNGLAAKWAAEHEKVLPVFAGELAPPHETSSLNKVVLDVQENQVADEPVSAAKGSERPPSALKSAVGALFATGPKRLPTLVDCESGDNFIVDEFPFQVGAAEADSWRFSGDGLAGTFFTLGSKRGECWLCPAPDVELYYDGQRLTTEIEIAAGQDHSIAINRQFFLLRMTSQPAAWINHINPHQWYIYRADGEANSGPYGWNELHERLRAMDAGIEQNVVYCSGMNIGFYATQLVPPPPEPMHPQVPKLADLLPPPSQHSPDNVLPPPDLPEIDAEHGEFTCPVCWLKFDRGDVMNVAVHASLRGDPVLGEATMQRFLATRFNDKGQALDPMNLPTSDQACPHCRRKLPPGFLDTPHLIFSIVGAPSSGKSYYLSVLVKQLQQVLFKEFNVIFRDADPSENVILTQMKTTLFSAGTPQEAILAKTALEGDLYETLPRYGRRVRLPKPFIFRLSSAVDPREEASVVFYDNAGEHFEPTRNSADSPGAQHIAVASGIFFLFDPLHTAEFRAKLDGVTDPQLATQRMDQQDVILAETEVRIKSLLGLDSRQRVDTPFAFMIGKCDTWIHLHGSDPLLPAIVDGRLHLGNIRANSTKLRHFMLEVAPAVVANAEAISNNVMYFAISPLGASPVEFIDSHDGLKRIGPDPKHLNPRFVEIPTLWVLSHLIKNLIPSDKEIGYRMN